MSFEILIKNGRIIDGTGNLWFRSDIGIKDGKIVEISRSYKRNIDNANKVIDAEGLIVAPGFYDLHNHADSSISVHNKAENLLHMGCTTIVTGNCGRCDAPITAEHREFMQEDYLHHLPPPVVEVDWLTVGEWRESLHRKGIGVNIAHCSGHNTIRKCVMGYEGKGGERSTPTEVELEAMKKMVAQAMEDGAFGMTTGLAYSPGRNAYTEEVIELCKVVARYGGVYSSHIRSEGETLIEATKELIEICETAGLPGCISHHKASGEENRGKPSETMRLIDEARERGVEIYCDVYPWVISGGESLGMALIRGHSASRELLESIKRDELLKEIKDKEKWKKLKKEYLDSYEKGVVKNEDRRRKLEKKGIKIPRIRDPKNRIINYSKTRPDLAFKTLGEVAEAMGSADYLEAMRDLYVADEGFTYVSGGRMREEDLITILRHPASSPSTDGYSWDLSTVPFSYGVEERLRWNHPRGWGTYPKILQKYVREMKILRLEEAIKKMTSLPAQFLGLQDRGLIKEGMWADIVLFDSEKVMNRATYANPCQYPVGIPYVIVNGQIVIDGGELTENLPGRVLFHKGF